MTLARLLLAWLPTTIWFFAAQWIARRWIGPPDPFPDARRMRTVAVVAGEALGVTLFASLWFDSLGHGGWWLLFALVGALVGFGLRVRDPLPSGDGTRALILGGLADVARYVGAGAVLAWRLG